MNMAIVWILFTTIVGGLVGNYVPTLPHPAIGALIGFIFGLACLCGAGGDVADGICDIDFD
jgi:hypothetical protein